MKTRFYIFFALILLLSTLATTCNNPKVTGVTLSSDQLVLYMNKTATLVATVHPIDAANKEVIWTSSNNNVATVENGKVTAITQGTATITVTTEEGYHKATCTVEVLHPAEPEMVFVEGGTYIMWCLDCKDEHDYENCEIPIHQKVTVGSFKIAKFLLTIKQWSDMFGDSIPLQYGNIPFGAWYMFEEVIQKLNEITGKNYRLPTLAEWQYAARGGNKSKGYRYSGSNDIDEVARYRGNSLDEFGNIFSPLPPVGTKKPNELGIYDMSGLLWEVCSDGCVHPLYPAGNGQEICGGSLIDDPCNVLSARCSINDCACPLYIGIRLVLP